MGKYQLSDEEVLQVINRLGYKKSLFSLILGTLPTPVGGVSTFLNRLKSHLNKAGIFPDVFNPSESPKPGYNFWGLLFRLLQKRYDQVRIHSPSLQSLSAILIARLFTRFDIYFTVHNPVLFSDISIPFRFVLGSILNKAVSIIAVSQLTRQTIIDSKPHLENKIVIQSSYLPPDLERKEEIKGQYPASLVEFLQSHSPTFILNAYKIHFKDGIDVYGFDLSIELLIRLSKKIPNVGLILAYAVDEGSSKYIADKTKYLDELGLKKSFFALEGFPEIWPIFEDCEVMLRPTLYDGLGISVGEAILMGCPVIASDAAERQPECHIFKSRNIDDLEKVSLEVLSELGFQNIIKR